MTYNDLDDLTSLLCLTINLTFPSFSPSYATFIYRMPSTRQPVLGFNFVRINKTNICSPIN